MKNVFAMFAAASMALALSACAHETNGKSAAMPSHDNGSYQSGYSSKLGCSKHYCKKAHKKHQD